MTDQTNGTPGGTPGGEPAGNTGGSFVRQRAAQMAASMQQAEGNEPAADVGEQQQQQQPQSATPRPPYVLETEWDATTGRPNDKFAERMNGLVARGAERDAGDAALPKSAEEYRLEHSANFTLPPGVELEPLSESDPIVAQFRQLAHARGLDQGTFSEFVDLYQAIQAVPAQRQQIARQRNLDALGGADVGAQRVENISFWLRSRAGDEGAALADFILRQPMAPMVKAMEAIARQFARAGGADPQRARQEQKLPGNPQGYVATRVAQMAQKFGGSPPGGRRGE